MTCADAGGKARLGAQRAAVARRLIALGSVLTALSGCALKPPTIAHVHAGHSVTAWRDTPNQNGLLVTAEVEADRVAESARDAVEICADLAAARMRTAEVVELVSPETRYSGQPGENYGLKRALIGVIDHLEFAAEADDASENFRASVPKITERAGAIVERADEILFLGPAVELSRSADESCPIAGEIQTLAKTIVDGSDSQQYGLVQLRQDIVNMIDNERPAYRTVDSWYLLNIVRLPSGRWDFVQGKDEAGGDGDGGNGY